MGGILSIFSRGNGDANIPDWNFNPENSTPTEAELSLHERLSEHLHHTDKLLDSLQRYEGCGDVIRKAISNPTEESQEEAWQAVQPAVA
ncbi:16714_t:CDS:2, partial [Acaulospora morrowiae]